MLHSRQRVSSVAQLLLIRYRIPYLRRLLADSSYCLGLVAFTFQNGKLAPPSGNKPPPPTNHTSNAGAARAHCVIVFHSRIHIQKIQSERIHIQNILLKGFKSKRAVPKRFTVCHSVLNSIPIITEWSFRGIRCPYAQDPC